MSCYGLFHFDLHVSVCGVHVVKLFSSAVPQVFFLFCIKIFVEVENFPRPAQEQSQVVESGIFHVAVFV